MAQRTEPVLGYNFVISFVDSGSTLATAPIDIKRSPLGGFSECSGLETTLEVEPYKEGGNNAAELKFPTRTTWANIRLRRGVAHFDDLWRWHYDFVEGKGKRRDGLIILQDEQHNAVKVWQFTRGLPVKWTGPSMNAAQSQVAIEELEIAHEGLKLLPASLSITVSDISEAAANVAGAVRGLF
jgi:phage tail-like protein